MGVKKIGDVSRYAITVTNTEQFQLVAQYLAAGLSFRQVSHVIMETRRYGQIR
jgi:hypothetical protein